MCLKNDRNRRVAIDDDLSDARALVSEMVEGEEARTVSRELAYDNVGRRLGRSDSWVYRLTSGQHVGLSRATWRRIAAAYQAHCERLERAAEAARQRAAILRAEADELEARLARREGG